MASPVLPDWRVADDYAWLLEGDRACFAWEWLRRDPRYRRLWHQRGAALRFGLIARIDPGLDARSALPLWSARVDPGVLVGSVVGGLEGERGGHGGAGGYGDCGEGDGGVHRVGGDYGDRGDYVDGGGYGDDVDRGDHGVGGDGCGRRGGASLKGADLPGAFAGAALRLRDFGLPVRLVSDGVLHHCYLGDGVRGLRLDLVAGAGVDLSIGPLVVRWHLVGLAGLAGPLRTLRRLLWLAEGDAGRGLGRAEARAGRWVLALRAFDGLACGATHQALARGLFGPLVPPARWRIEAASIRLRIQRLVLAARTLAALPPAAWFA